MDENNTAVVKVGNEVGNWFCIKSGVKQDFYHLMEHRTGNGRPRNQMGRKNSPGLRIC